MTNQEECPLHWRRKTQRKGSTRQKGEARTRDGEKTKAAAAKTVLFFHEEEKVTRPGTARTQKKP